MAMPAEYIKATLVSRSLQRDHFYNIFWYYPEGMVSWTSSPMADAVTLAHAIKTNITPNMIHTMTADSIIDGLNVNLHKGGQEYNVSILINQAGVVASDELADFECVIIQKRTSVAGKSGRGRWLVGPVPESQTDENYLLDASFDPWQTVANDWINSFTSMGVSWFAALHSQKLRTLQPLNSNFVVPKLGLIEGRKSKSIL